MRYSSLFSPVQIGSVEAHNRVMQLATTNNLDVNGAVGDALIAFYEERAKNGVGMIVTEGLGAHHSAQGSHETSLGRARVGAFDRAVLDGLTRLADAIHRHDVPIFGQIFHGGRQHHADRVPLLWAPSPIPCPHSGGMPHEMNLEEIESTIHGFVTAAEVLRDAGFDGVEVHGAQGHLIQEFLSEYSNARRDGYGGSFDGRMRLLREILDAVRVAVGDDFVVGFRLAGEEHSPGGIDLEGSCQIAAALADDGVIDYLSISMGNFNSIEIHTPDRHFPIAPFLHYPAAIREAVGQRIPVVGCGRILTPDRAEQALISGEADVVGLCRPLLADERWAAKARDGDDADIRVCISCNQCWGAIIDERPVLCVQNAVTGNEIEFGTGTLTPAEESRRVVVVGGGPAGMEAARVATERGHAVILFEAEKQLGGAVAIASTIPGHGEIGNVTAYLTAALDRLGVDVRLGRRIGVDEILDEMPDAVVIATGSVPRSDDLGAPTDFPVLTSFDVVRERVPTGERAIIFDEDGYYQAPEVAELMAKNGTRTWIVTRFWEVGREIPATSRVTTVRSLDDFGVELVPTAWISRVDGRDVVLAHYYTGREWTIPDVDTLVHIGHNHVQDDLYHDLRGRVPRIALVGDAYQPRRIHDAVSEGHRIGRSL